MRREAEAAGGREAFLSRFGWAPTPEAGVIYEDLEGPEPASLVRGAVEPSSVRGWAALWRAAERLEAAWRRRQAAIAAEWARSHAAGRPHYA
jgi:hypothetical protein